MIIEFSASNFRSIQSPVNLSMIATKLTGKESIRENFAYPSKYKNLPVLRSAIIYGANASGKSNFLKAMDFFAWFVTNSTNLKPGQNIHFEPFRLFKDSLTLPSHFEMDFIATDDIRYQYGFSVNDKDVIEEHLISYASRKPTEVFSRKKGEAIKFSSSFKGQKKILEEQLQNNHLLLTKAAISNFEQFSPIYSYFSDNLKIVTSVMNGSMYTRKKSFEDESFRKSIIDFLKVADTGINSFAVTKKDNADVKGMDFLPDNVVEQMKENLSYQADVIHFTCDGGTPEEVRWNLEEESTGTKKLFSLAGPIIDILKNGHVLVFDELNNSLHPLISEFIVNLFNNKETNPRNAQLILTTHDTTLLNKHTFRRDQIWFAEKNSCGITELYSLCTFDKKSVRWDIPFDKWYLSGRFGALPMVKDFHTDKSE